MVLKLVFGVSCALEGNVFARTPENTSVHPQGEEYNDEETLLCFSDSQARERGAGARYLQMGLHVEIGPEYIL